MIAHNGEINTLRGNVNWMRARESQLASRALRRRPRRRCCRSSGRAAPTRRRSTTCSSCSCSRGRSLPHAMMMMIPEAYDGPRRPARTSCAASTRYHDCLIEAWDGPAAIAFTDGRVIGATLDRNGLRPGRWLETRDGWVVLASEAGVLDIPPGERPAQGPAAARASSSSSTSSGADRPGRGGQARGRDAAAVRASGSSASTSASPTCRRGRPRAPPTEPLRQRQLAFGYTQEDMKVMLAPLARERRGGDRLDGQRHAARGRSPTASRSSTRTSSSSSRRSRTRRSTRSARRS